MNHDARLERALAAAGAPRRDPAFTLAVLQAAESRRFRIETLRSALRAGGLAAAAAALAAPLIGWTAADPEALATGAVAAGSLLALALTARLMTQRAAAWVR